MELHRLNEMPANYNEELFNRIYKETRQLRKSLANQIDNRRYNVSKDIILSWFDDKFIFTYCKYFQEKNPDLLKGYIISSLQFFKNRILRKAYGGEAEIYSNIIDLSTDGAQRLINIIPDNTEIDNKDLFLELCINFFKEKLSQDAFFLLDLQLNPPSYIQERASNRFKISSELLAEYLGLPNGKESIQYINQLKEEISYYTKEAREYFSGSLSSKAYQLN